MKTKLNKHENTKTRPQLIDEQSVFGHMPNPEHINSSTTLDQAKKMGLYTEGKETHPHELNIAQEIDELNQSH